MTSTIFNTTVDSADPWALAEFWSQVLDLPISEDCSPGDEEVAIPLHGDHDLLFVEVHDPKSVKNRMHLCLQPDGPREQEVDRLLSIGATMVDDRRELDGTGWAVLADPEDNEFCVLRSAAEREATD